MANPLRTAAAGAQGAVIRRLVPPKVGATRPSAKVPRMPASAPTATNAAPRGEKMVTPKAMAEGSATNIAARPPQNSFARLLGLSMVRGSKRANDTTGEGRQGMTGFPARRPRPAPSPVNLLVGPFGAQRQE